MDLTLLDNLKERLLSSKNFSEVWSYFLDHFGEIPGFTSIGQRVRHEVVESLIVQTAKQVANLEVQAEETILTAIPEHQFIHGGYCKNGRMINVLYFEDINVGTMMFCTIGSPQTTMLRFTGQKAGDLPMPSMN